MSPSPGVSRSDPSFAAQASAALASLSAPASAERDVRRAYAESIIGLGDLPRAEVETRAAVASLLSDLLRDDEAVAAATDLAGEDPRLTVAFDLVPA